MGPFCVFIVCKNFKTFCVSGLAWLVHCSRFWHPACTRCKNDMHPLLLGMLPRSGISFAVLAVSTRKIPDPVQERAVHAVKQQAAQWLVAWKRFGKLLFVKDFYTIHMEKISVLIIPDKVNGQHRAQLLDGRKYQLVDFGLLGRKEQGDSLQHHLLVESGQDTEAAAIRVATVRIAEDF